MAKSSDYRGVTGKHTKNGTPNGFTSITPFITVKNPSEAIEFYKAVFNARVKNITEYPDGNGNRIIVHAELDFGNGFLQLGGCESKGTGSELCFRGSIRKCIGSLWSKMVYYD